jgi:alkylation response protein AidB-like acyl-CoA dehydrogenase
MDFAFSDEQQMLRDSARSYLAEKYGLDEVAKLAKSDEGWRPESFKEIAELGWTGLSVPEEQGGAGMGFIDEIVVFEELGRALYPGPYFSSVALALPALRSSGELAGAIAAGDKSETLAWAEPPGGASITDTSDIKTKAEKTNGAWTLTGEKHLVPDLAIADLVVVSATTSDGVGLWAVETDAAQSQPRSTMDTTRRYGNLTLSSTPGEVVVEPGQAEETLAVIRTRALAAAAVEAIGVAQRTLELAIEHVKERKQFDKPIGSYQAVSHQVADSFAETEVARSLAYWAAWCVDESDEQVTVAVPAAKAAAGQAAVAACERAIQVHGGIGFTWEHPLHLFYKRAQWLNAFEGFPAHQRSQVAGSLLG